MVEKPYIKRTGFYRCVFVTKNYAIKIPNHQRTLIGFLEGWVANTRERDYWRKTKDVRVCPVLFSLFGLAIVMPRVRPLTPSEKEKFDYGIFLETDNFHIPAELKIESVGVYNNRLVIYDYDL